MLAPPDSAGVIIDGNARMRERPIGELTGGITALGGRIEFRGHDVDKPRSLAKSVTVE